MTATTKLTLINEQRHESFHIGGGGYVQCFISQGFVYFLFYYYLVIFVVKWLPFCIPHWFEIHLVLIVLVFIVQMAFRGMSRMLTFLLALFPKLAKLFFLCKQPPLLCFSLVIFLLLIGVGFGPNLVPSWGCLNLVSCAFICFIGSFEPFRTSSSRLFVNSLTKLSNT